ncbi:pyridoxamine 5'-phosphate oxidase family protein [Actinosynnema pretiosum subsp. pretiosum]|uniref:Pyridoxamine 5'-phosphate oxidase-related FMN-binding n=2 Tax=Actinosynnema TaxID=40566 RepID=C6WP25_ACTMD|nr:pyridoxamine 5'-phosphate oxidase family protein [Actinosynnema mirum]ACU36694.1 pyridoxamine 5'-phosphate oxidase-related FMN- binding [Actinosynnema mirum DSM 43827]AXX30155.1 Pyridoxamine 5'-phosphate oxidase [Actinosynnema pretiosum subsp. pretiosum]QUF05684.1 pyridoxamine 5'-phosphate oxidase family protein [Actinosynnema pretiosum subsp. pretiosum]
MSSTESPLTRADREFLTRPLHGFLTTAAGPTPPQARPIWFDLTDDGLVQFISAPDALKVRRLRRDPRASLVVAAPVEERERWVAVTGRVTIEPSAGRDLYARMAARYWDLSDPTRESDLAEVLAQDWDRLVLHPESVRRVTF